MVAMRRYFTIQIAIVALMAMGMFSAVAPAYAWEKPQWENMPLACLPDRAQKWEKGKSEIQQAPCHCPPASMCPSISDWNNQNGWAMTPYFVDKCCEQPQCTTTYRVNAQTRCPGMYMTGLRVAAFCRTYKAKETQNVEEAKLRKQAANGINKCMSKCTGLLGGKTLEQLNGKANINAVRTQNDSNSGYVFGNFGFKLVKSTDADAKLFEKYVDCEYNCRVKASEKLGIAEPRSFYKTELMNILMGQGVIDAPEDSHEFLKKVFGDKWRRSDADRKQRVQEYLTEHPGNLLNPGAGLAKKLECEEAKPGGACTILVLNNGSCRSCLAAGTQVELADGTKKSIETLGAGDVVKGLDDEGYPITSKVTELVKRDWPTLQLYRINDGMLTLTADHPVRTVKGWRAVDYSSDYEGSVDKYGLADVPKLAEGDLLMTDGGTLQVKKIEAGETKKNGVTYNLRLEGGDSFFANGVLVRSN